MPRSTSSTEFQKPQSLSGADIGEVPEQAQAITFPACPEPTLGVELEVSLVDLQTRNLAPRAPEVLERLPDRTHCKPELFRTIIELNTDICRTVAEVRADIAQRLAGLRAVCADL